MFIELDKNAKILMSIFNGCHTKLEFFTVCKIESNILKENSQYKKIAF